MKKIVILCVLILGILIPACQLCQGQTVSRRGGGMKVDGVRIPDAEMYLLLSDIDGEDYSDFWATQRSRRKAGIWMIAGGSAVALTGLAVGGVSLVALVFSASIASVGGQEAVDNVSRELAPWMIAGGSACVLGLGTAIAGIPVTVLACKRMNRVVDRYNAAAGGYLSVGPTRSGVGIAWNF